MTEEPKQEDRDAQGTEQKDLSWGNFKEYLSSFPEYLTQLSKAYHEYLTRFFRVLVNHATFASSLLYFYVTAMGLLYSAVLYGEFGINIFDYSEIGDFFLAAFKNPALGLVALQVFLGVAIVILVAAGDKVLSEKEGSRTVGLSRGAIWNAIIVGAGVVLASLLSYWIAIQDASSIKDGENLTVDVRYRSFSSSTGQVTESGLELIGATQRAVFFFDVNDKDVERDNRTLVIPQAQIVSIEVPD
jgi:hypothetical protein